MKIRAIIIDDELHAINILTKLTVALLDDDVEIIATGNSVKSGIEVINIEKPELVFLDIRMPDGEGFEVIEKVEFKNFEVIFFTNYDDKDNIMRALKLSAIDFLVKPIDPNELIKSIERYKQHKKERHTNISKAKRETLIGNIKKPEYLLLYDQWTKKISLDSIIACEANGNYTTIYINGRNKLFPAKKLKHFENILANNRFVRCHRSFLINLSFVKGIKKYNKHFILKKNESTIKKIPISKSYYKKVAEMFYNKKYGCVN